MIKMFKWLLCEIFGYAGDHAWVSVWMDDIVMLADGTTSAGYLMMRSHKGAREFRHMTAQEELETMRTGVSIEPYTRFSIGMRPHADGATAVAFVIKVSLIFGRRGY